MTQIQIGELRHPIRIERPVPLANADGDLVANWVLWAEPFAKIEPALRKNTVYHQVTVRFIPGLSPLYRVRYGRRIFAIEAALDLDELHRWHELWCLETANPFWNLAGESATLTRVTTVYTPATGADASTRTDYAARAMLPRKYSFEQVANSTTEEGDVMIAVAAEGLGITPKAGTDTLTLSGVVYRIIKTEGDTPSGVVNVWNLQCRK